MKISVIIPVYNAQNTIVRALESVINQTVKPFEIIIVNDGSSDQSLVILNKYIVDHPLYNFILINKKNGGVSSARNEGLKVAKGDLVSFLDSDDEWLINKTEKQIAVLNSKQGFSFIGGLISTPENLVVGNVDEINLKQLIFKNYFQPSTVMFRIGVIDKVGLFDESQKYAEEGNYFIRIAKLYKCALLYEQVVIYDQGKSGFGQSGLSSNLKEMEKGELLNLKFAYNQGYISWVRYVIAVSFSILKYFRRIIIVRFRK
ncbi:MAG: glycosyltransferase family A protein [Flavobacterium sp.]|uniref:glycosyltransferase family 2 protein n=1 Tax=Flavobacterium sp. TaxID=239 RepID=UPI002639D4C1|nr:glycosyltransferase family A protein [Flavobacterium sp.]MDD5151450.1 glycosyltransferase family A protein [Flavobacterium sp.]